MNEEAFYVDTDTTILIEKLRDSYSGTAITDATISAQLKDMDEDNVDDGAIASFTHEGSGDYTGVLDAAADMTAGTQYYLEVTVVKAGATLVFRMIRFARYYVE